MPKTYSSGTKPSKDEERENHCRRTKFRRIENLIGPQDDTDLVMDDGCKFDFQQLVKGTHAFPSGLIIFLGVQLNGMIASKKKRKCVTYLTLSLTNYNLILFRLPQQSVL